MELRLGWDEKDQFSSIVSVRPLRYAYVKIAILVASTVVMTVFGMIVLAKLAALPLIVLTFIVVYLKLNSHYLFQYLFFDVSEENTVDILYYAIRDLSFITQAQESQYLRKSNKVYIVKAHQELNQVKYFHFKEELYKIEKDTVNTVNQIDILNILEVDNIREYAETGLNAERIAKSLCLFGHQKQYLNPTRQNFVIKRLIQEKELALVNLLLLLISIFVVQSLLVGITLLVIDVAIVCIIWHDEGSKVHKFYERFKAISDKTFLVLRSGQSIRVSYSQIVVGDIIEIERADVNEEYMVCFKSLIMADFQIICKQGTDKEETYKKPVRELYNLRQDQSRYTLHALSYIESASLKGNERLIVLENNSISKFFSLWFEKARYMEFQTITKDNSFRIAKIFIMGIAILFIVDLIISIATRNITRAYNAETFTDILFVTFIVPAILHLLFTLNHQKSMQDLQAQNIEAYGVNIAQAGIISNIVMDFSELLQIQFQEILYKNIIFDPSNRQFQPDKNTLENGKTYESLLAVIFYISLGYFDQQDGKSTLLNDVFSRYADYFNYEDRIDSGKTIVHKQSDKRWIMVGRDLQNQKGARSWRIQYENNVKYCITECNVKNEGNFIDYIGKEDHNRLNTYIELAEGLIEEGKKLKLILFKNYKKDGLRGTGVLEQQMQQFVGRRREELEKDMQFAAFIVFDNALKLQNSASIQFLRDFKTPNGKTFNIFIYSESRDVNLAGFEHILQYIPIHYSFKAHEKTAFVRQKMSERGTLVFGSDIGDQYGELQADIAMKRIADGSAKDDFQLPTDVFIRKIEDIKILLEVGNFSAKYRIEAAKYISTVWFWMIFGWLWIGARGQTKEISNSTWWVLCLMLLLVFAPLALKTQYFFERSLKYYGRSLKILTMNYVFQLVLNIFISIIILTVVSQQKLCESANEQEKTHIITLRKNSQEAVWNCINLPLLLGGSASNVAFVIFYEESNPSQALEWWRFCLPVSWLVMMIIARFPLKLVLLCLAIMTFLILLKVLVKAVEPKEPSQEKDPIQNEIQFSE